VQVTTEIPLTMAMGVDEIDFVGSVTEVAVRVTVPSPAGTAAGAW
jgi:hypothetical protein